MSNKKSVLSPATGKPAVSTGEVTVKGKADCKACGGSGKNSKGELCICVPPLMGVEYQSKLQVAHEAMVDKLGREIIVATGEVAGKYLTLCLYIRQHKLGPKEVSVPLTKLGFKRSRISEINRVANAANDVWNDFEAMQIGFKKVLELERGTVVEVVAHELGMEKNELVGAKEENEEHASGSTGEGGNTSGDEKETNARKFERISASLLKLAAEMKLTKGRRVNIGNGFILEVSKDKKFGKPKVKKTDGVAE